MCRCRWCAVAGAAASQKRFGEERRFVGGGGTLVGQAGHDHRQAAALEAIQRGAGSGRAFQRVDVVGRVGEAGQLLGRQLGTERDHQAVVGQLGFGGFDLAVSGIDLEHLGLEHLDPRSAQASPVGADLLGAASPGHHPQKRWREPVGGAAVDEHDPVGGVQRATEAAGGHHPAGTTAEDYNGAICHGRNSSVRR